MKGFWREGVKRLAAVLGVVLWVGSLSPEIFVKIGIGCILNENGEALTEEEADEFMESYFLQKEDGGQKKQVKYRIALAELLDSWQQ